MSKFDPKQYLTDLRGQQYLEVKWRLVWFRADHPGGNVETEVVSMDPLLVRAIVTDADGKRLATGHGGADAGGRKVVWSGREFEKAETAAIGRALAHAGYGTQFTGETEGDHLADSPVTPPAPRKAPPMKVVGGRTNDKPAEPDALVQDTATLAEPDPNDPQTWPAPHLRENLITLVVGQFGLTPADARGAIEKVMNEGAIKSTMTNNAIMEVLHARAAEKSNADPKAKKPA